MTMLQCLQVCPNAQGAKVSMACVTVAANFTNLNEPLLMNTTQVGYVCWVKTLQLLSPKFELHYKKFHEIGP